MSVGAADPQTAAADILSDRLSSPFSPVSRKDRPWGFVAGLAGVIGLGLIVFLSLNAGRHRQAPPAPPPPPAAVPAPPPEPVPVPPPEPAPPAPPPAEASDTDEQARLHAPAMLVDLSDAPEPGPGAPGPASGAPAQGPAPGAKDGGAGSATLGRGNANEAFADRVAGSQVDTAHATRLANPALTAPQGTVISAVLETGINSDLPGFVRGVVSRDVRGFDGTHVLIPRGSKLIGEYKNAVAQGQSRAFVIWTRLLTPSGVSINLGSPAADRLGRGGVPGEANTHFLHRFGAAIMLSVINAGLQSLVNQNSNNSVNAVVIGSPVEATNVATLALQKDIDIPTTITVPQGQAIRVFVARDLDFSEVVGAR